MSGAREQLEELVEKALRDGTDYDPNGVDSIVGRVMDALLDYGSERGVGYRAGWLLAYGKVHEVTETDSQDGWYAVFAGNDSDPEENEG